MVEARSERLPRRDAAVALTATDVAGQYLRGVTLSVHAGEIVGVAGLLGSGREELPYILAGAQRLETGGTVTVGDATFAEITVERAQSLGLVLVPADRAREGIFADFTTGENVSLASLPAISSGGALRPSSEHRFSRHWLAAVGADPGVVDRKITMLSGGNQQKAVLARWLSTEPTVLMLSEPTAGVDAGARRVIYAELRARADQGLAILMSSSDVEDLLAVCDRVIVLRDGSITAELVAAEATKAAIVAAMEGVHGEQG
jgi:ribose transport system ATP-binding protein